MDTVYLRIDRWNDYNFVTMFDVYIYDEFANFHEIGAVKIGFSGQEESVSTHSSLGDSFESLPDGYFSLGVDVSYYDNIVKYLSPEFRGNLLRALNDIAEYPEIFDRYSGERVLNISLLRSVSLSAVKGQFKRVLDGGSVLTDYTFDFIRPEEEGFAGVELSFDVKKESTPRTNIHAIIGRNGVGKTTLLNEMTMAIVKREESSARFIDKDYFGDREIAEDYFSSLVSVAFSAFDPFEPPAEQNDPALGTCYYYIGLKKKSREERESRLMDLSELHDDFLSSLGQCFSQNKKKERWLKAISSLESDDNFAEMGLSSLAGASVEKLNKRARRKIEMMSTGHASVLITLTKLVATVEEKTLVLIDEPETHLHPPLLSAFIRALSELLFNRNGVAIIATHSPVVLQEIPSSCVWKLTRSQLALSPSRPEIETFGENVGVLTREVFGLEVSKSGFHKLLADAVEAGSSYEEILVSYDGQLGLEAKGVLGALIARRTREVGSQ